MATFFPRPCPTSAAVVPSISLIPGPPFGPSYLITTTSPSSISPFETASNAISSLSNTLAIPVNSVISTPAVLITAPSGAKLPFKITAVPTLWIGESADLTICCSEISGIVNCSILSLIVFPVTVIVFGLIKFLSNNFLSTNGIPPILSKLFMT